jgi:hypothetical protein
LTDEHNLISECVPARPTTPVYEQIGETAAPATDDYILVTPEEFAERQARCPLPVVPPPIPTGETTAPATDDYILPTPEEFAERQARCPLPPRNLSRPVPAGPSSENRYRPSAEPANQDLSHLIRGTQALREELQAQRKEQTQIKHLMSDRQSTMPGLENIVEELREVKETQKAMETNLYKKLRAIRDDVKENGEFLEVIQEWVVKDDEENEEGEEDNHQPTVDQHGNDQYGNYHSTNDEAENLKRLHRLNSRWKKP